MKAIDLHAARDEVAEVSGSNPPHEMELAPSPLKLNGHIAELTKVNGVKKSHGVEAVNGYSNGTLNGHDMPLLVNGHGENGHIVNGSPEKKGENKVNGSPVNGYANGSPVNGHSVNGPINGSPVNGHPISGVNGAPHVNGPSVNGLPVNGTPTVHDSPVNGTLVNGLPVNTSSHSTPVNGSPVISNGLPVNGPLLNGARPKVNGLPANGPPANGPPANGLPGACQDGTVARLEGQLTATRHELQLRDEEVARLTRIRTEVEAELEDLTASLFQEAHNMVRVANVAQAQAERSLKESQMKVEVLQAEVAALKTLVLTSTPSRPNTHLHPQLQGDHPSGAQATSGMNLFNRKHRRSPSHFNLKYGRENSPPDSPVREVRGSPEHQREATGGLAARTDDLEVDPVVHKEFVAWKLAPRLDRSEPFVARVYREDIELCLDFCNAELGARVRDAIEAGTVFIEAVTEKSRTVFPKKCALMEVQRLCHYRMRLGDEEQWYYISQICRNRITAVCDFLNYLRYIERGLVKSSVHDVFWEIVRLRKEMVLARLGLPLS